MPTNGVGLMAYILMPTSFGKRKVGARLLLGMYWMDARNVLMAAAERRNVSPIRPVSAKLLCPVACDASRFLPDARLSTGKSHIKRPVKKRANSECLALFWKSTLPRISFSWLLVGNP